MQNHWAMLSANVILAKVGWPNPVTNLIIVAENEHGSIPDVKVLLGGKAGERK